MNENHLQNHQKSHHYHVQMRSIIPKRVSWLSHAFHLVRFDRVSRLMLRPFKMKNLSLFVYLFVIIVYSRFYIFLRIKANLCCKSGLRRFLILFYFWFALSHETILILKVSTWRKSRWRSMKRDHLILSFFCISLFG